MRLEPLYRCTFAPTESWHVGLSDGGGTEGQGFLLVEGRSEGRLTGRLRAANYPRQRTDGTLTPEFRGVLETDDGAVVLFAWHGYGVATDVGSRQLLGSVGARSATLGSQGDPPCGRGVGRNVKAVDLSIQLDPDRSIPPLGQRAPDVEVVVEALQSALRRPQLGERAPQRLPVRSAGLGQQRLSH